MFKTRLRVRAASGLLAAASLGLSSVAAGTESDQPEPGDTQLNEISVPLTRRATEPAAGSGSPHALKLLGMEVPPGSSRRLSWSASEIFEGISETTPVLAVNGAEPGPVLCLTGAVHGDELNGIEIVRRVIHNLDPQKLQGAVIGVPIVNLQGFRRASRYLPDRRDLNRYFPGNPRGSSAARIAHSFFNEIIVHCDALVDLHTGSFHRTNLPQIRADVRHPGVVDLTHGFDSMVVLHSPPSEGTLRRAATAAGIPAVTMEVGEPMRLQPEEVERGEEGIESLLNSLGMIRKLRFWSEPEPVYYESTWIRSDHGGLLITAVELGQQISRNERLATVTDPITNQSHDIVAPSDGRVLGMALNQVVMPGFAAIRLGLPTSEAQAIRSAQQIGLAQESKRANVDDILYAIRGEADGNTAPVTDDAAD
jgi:predicted deacylase